MSPLPDVFPATVRKNGSSKSITIPVEIATKYEIGQTIKVKIEA